MPKSITRSASNKCVPISDGPDRESRQKVYRGTTSEMEYYHYKQKEKCWHLSRVEGHNPLLTLRTDSLVS